MYIGSAHWSCNVNLKLTKNVPVLVHNFEDYGIHSIMQETGKFDVKTSGIPNGLENAWLIQSINLWFLLTACNL